MNRMIQANFFSLPSQGNVYTFAHLQLANKINKLLVASLKRQVFTFEYNKHASGALIPTTKEIPFAYIPSGAEIISITAFNKSEGNKNDFVIGITIIKSSADDNSLETFLNIYSDEEFNIDAIAQNCLCIELNFIPYHLTFTDLITWKDDECQREKVFVLSGSDNKIHVYRETKENFKEIECDVYFPEFYNPPAVVHWICIHYIDSFTRISAFGCENGYLRLVKVNCKDNSITLKQSTQFASAITQIQLYERETTCSRPSFLLPSEADTVNATSRDILDMMVVNAVLPVVHFRNVAKNGLTDYRCIRKKDSATRAICATIADINFDGRNEILLGNSQEEIMMFEFENVGDTSETELNLSEIMKTVGPVLHLLYLDINNDGVKELIVFTTKGLYIFQHDPLDITESLRKKVEAITFPSC